MNCRICGQAMVAVSKVNDARGVGAWYSCPWCYADVLALRGKDHFHPGYSPIDERWAACTVESTGPTLEHAAHHDATICGITDQELLLYRHHWHPGRDACTACEEFAETVDGRWPPAERAG